MLIAALTVTAVAASGGTATADSTANTARSTAFAVSPYPATRLGTGIADELSIADVADSKRPDGPAGSVALRLDNARWEVAWFDPGSGEDLGAHLPARPEADWLTTESVTTAQAVLLQHHRIDDPLTRGARDSSWVAGKEWWYRTSFSTDEGWSGRLVQLHVKGVMELGDVWLNGVHVGSTKGMYDEAWLDVAEHLAPPGRVNVLAIRARAAEGGWSDRVSIAANEAHWRGFQYSNALRPIGLWRGVDVVVTGRVRLAGTFVRTVGDLTAASKSATVRVEHTVQNTTDAPLRVRLRDTLAPQNFGGPPVSGHTEVTVPPGTHRVSQDLVVAGNALRLWWPNGFGPGVGGPDGPRFLYTLRTQLHEGDTLLDTRHVSHIGIRSLTYRLTDGAPADHYRHVYVVNGEPVYAQGGNWVPSDPLYRPAVMQRIYDELLWLAAKGNVTMLRVWGGGIEENAGFYQRASEYGIPVLQEFWHWMVAYDVDYPVWRANADDIVRRLRNYPAVARYSGGNELTGTTTGDRERAEALPYVRAVADSYLEHDGTRGEFLATSPAGGSVHRWEHLHMVGVEGYEQAHLGVADFLSELGMNSAPSASTWNQYGGEGHATDAHRRIGEEWIYPNEYGAYRDVDDVIRFTQLAQGLGMAYNAGWQKTHKWANAGALMWQYNDMAPMVGWGVVDYGRAPKWSYYLLKREFRPVHVRASYDRYWFDPGEQVSLDVHVINDTRQPLTGMTVRATAITMDGQVIAERAGGVDVPANADGGVAKAFTATFDAPGTPTAFLVHLELLDRAGNLVVDNTTWMTTEPNRSMYTLAGAPVADLAVADVVDRGVRTVRITNRGDVPAFGVELLVEGLVDLSDNVFAVLPGQTKSITVTPRGNGVYRGPITVRQMARASTGPNLAAHRPTYASHDDYSYRTGTVTRSERRALYATDGDTAYTAVTSFSQWQSATAKQVWLRVDLGRRTPIGAVRLLWGAQYATRYEIQVSDDAAFWRTVHIEESGDGGVDLVTLDGVTGRHVRLSGMASTGAYHLSEIEVFADHRVPPAPRWVPGAIELERIPVAETVDAVRERVDGDRLGYGAADRIRPTVDGGTGSATYRIGTQARTYRLLLGIADAPGGGRAAIAIDGRPVDDPIDTDGPHGPRELDLGEARLDAVTHAVTVTATGGPVLIDYLRLVPTDVLVEAESLPAHITGGSGRVFGDDRMSGRAGHLLTPSGSGARVAYTVSGLPDGRYRLVAGVKKQDARGIYQPTVNGQAWGGPIDMYAPSDTYPEVDLGVVEVTGHTLVVGFTHTGRNPASLGSSFALDYLRLTPTQEPVAPPEGGGGDPGCDEAAPRQEAECLPVSVSGATHRIFDDGRMSGGRGHLLSPFQAGASATYTVRAMPGTYHVVVGIKRQDTRGIYQASTGGELLGDPLDLYAPSDSYDQAVLGQVTVSASGELHLTFTHVGRNPASLGSTFALDYVELVSIG